MFAAVQCCCMALLQRCNCRRGGARTAQAGGQEVVLGFGVEALRFVTTTRALRRVLGKVFVMVLSCHSNDVDVFSLLLDCAFWGLTPPPSYSVVRGRGCTWSTHFVASMSFSYYSVWQELQGL